VSDEDRVFEFFLNRLRLDQAFSIEEFTHRTGLNAAAITAKLNQAIELEFLESAGDHYQVSDMGRRYLNDLQALFLPDS
jgi:oxygen-independent coproporphyrinogen-3 oxidase